MNVYLLYKGHVIKADDFVKAFYASGETAFYRVVRTWGSHGVFHAVTQEEAGEKPIEIHVQPDVRRR